MVVHRDVPNGPLMTTCVMISKKAKHELDRSCQFNRLNGPKAFVPNPCANHLPLVYGWSSVDLRLIHISLFMAVVNAFIARTYNDRQTSF